MVSLLVLLSSFDNTGITQTAPVPQLCFMAVQDKQTDSYINCERANEMINLRRDYSHSFTFFSTCARHSSSVVYKSKNFL